MEEQHKPAFDPTRHLTKVSGRDYLEVKWRIVWFHEHHPDGSIVTEMVQHQNQSAVFKASVSWATESGIATRTGWGSESSDDFGDYLEKAETKAVGRALAMAGFGTQFSPDHDFGADHQRVVDSPVDIRSARPASGNTISRAEATPRQIKYMHAMARELNLSPDDLEEWVQQAHGCTVFDLDRRGVSAMIEQLAARKAAQESPQATPAASNGAGQASMPITHSGSAGPITDTQRNIINQLLDPDAAGAASQRMFGVPVSKLTTEQAHELIDIERRAEAARN